MSGHGFGFHPGAAATAAITEASRYVLAIWPSIQWTGTANTGFSTLPIDPARTTAKPAMRLLVPPGQAYTDSLMLGVWAAANDRGTLTDNMGLEKVIVHYEGTAVDIPAPSYRTFTDANGNRVAYFGWWISIKHDGRHGTANLFFEAVPKDPTMQRRILGPFSFLPAAAPHDADLTVVPSQPEVWGSRFQTLGRAMEYIRLARKKTPRIRLMETALYRLDTWAQAVDHIACGWVLIEAPKGVTATIGGDPAHSGSLRTKVGPLHFRGGNLLVDTAYLSEIYNVAGTENWFDGVRFENSLGQFSNWFGRVRPVQWIARGRPYFTECTFDCQANAVRGSTLARGCEIKRGFDDQMSGCACAISNRVHDADSSGQRADVPSFSVQYGGPGNVATLQVSGRPGVNGRVFNVIVDGSSIGTFTAVNTGTTGGFYSMSDVVKWLNSLPGVAASLLSDRWAAVYVNVAGGGDAAIGATDIKKVRQTFVGRSFPHADLYASETFFENVIIADNIAWNNDVQLLFAGNTLKDFFIVNNGISHSSAHIWQFNSANSHVVVCHNSTDYELWLRSSMGYAMDAYCLYANNVVATINAPSNDFGLRMRNNHSIRDTSQMNSVGYSSGGTLTSLFVDPARGDFTPRSALRSFGKAPTLGYDRRREKRKPIDVVGAMAQH